MAEWRQRLRTRNTACLLWVALCFALTSAVYLSWLDRLVDLTDGATADWISMGAGYLCQAVGMGVVAYMLRRDPEADFKGRFRTAALLFAVACVPTLLTDTALGATLFGLVMNLLCGIVAGFYLYAVAANVDAERRATAFGGGYALATVVVGLLVLIGGGSFLHGRYALLLYLPLAALMALFPARSGLLDAPGPAAEAPEKLDGRELALACGVVLLLSLVKNLGFCFPSADIKAGLIPELSRLPYAVGLATAGFIGDRSRKQGMVCTVAALVIPFIMLGLSGEPISGTIFWGLNYLFFAFFSVFRAVLLMDLAHRTRRWELAPLGLLMGRLGDVAGTGAGILLGGDKVVLIAVTAALFFPTVFLSFRLYRRLYEPEAAAQKSEAEIFEAFCLHSDISSREREVLRLLLSNHTNGEIAQALFITESTVKYHVHNVLQKTGCKNRTELRRKYTSALYPGLEPGPTLTLMAEERTGS